MEIHPPEHPILTFKEFLVHIGTVTIGILIALSLEGLVEWNHHRHLVREARENIRSEIEDNERELKGHLETAAQIQHDDQNALQWIAEVESRHQSAIRTLTLRFNLAEMSNSSWSTAQAVGALGLMDDQEVKRASEVYRLQDQFVRLETAAEDATIEGEALFVLHDDPAKSTTTELETAKVIIAKALTAQRAETQIAEQLEKRYSAWLKTAK